MAAYKADTYKIKYTQSQFAIKHKTKYMLHFFKITKFKTHTCAHIHTHTCRQESDANRRPWQNTAYIDKCTCLALYGPSRILFISVEDTQCQIYHIPIYVLITAQQWTYIRCRLFSYLLNIKHVCHVYQICDHLCYLMNHWKSTVGSIHVYYSLNLNGRY